MSTDDYNQASSAAVPDVPDSAFADPPPPYPDPLRRHHNRSSRSHRPSAVGGASAIHGHGAVYLHSSETQLDRDTPLLSYSEEDDDGYTTESTPFLLANRAHGPRHSRQRSFSNSSTTSGVTSLTQTVCSLFNGDDDADDADIHCGGDCADCQRHQPRDGGVSVNDTGSTISSATLFKYEGCNRYFAPLRNKVYYKALFHLLVLNFPYALVAWIYLFIFTVTGTTTLIALPLGAILCFLNLLGARAFSRGELYLQTRFHQVYLPAYQPRPLFRRLRESPVEDHESGRVPCNVPNSNRLRLVKEHSFYKNTYAMFTDPTSYQALFYFLVIKPAITLLITILLIAVGIPSLILIIPAPVILRASRKVGVWQANIAIEGLYHAVR